MTAAPQLSSVQSALTYLFRIMAEQLDVRLVLETTDGVRDAGRICDLLSQHGVRTVKQFSAVTHERLHKWGINDYYSALFKARSLTRELATIPHTLPTVKQQLLVS